MGINITEIGQKVLDNNKNAANVFRKMYDLHYNSTPLDVPFEYIDENGNKATTNIPNVANFRKKIWDDVGRALGQFNRTFYVDAQNGDDNNTGSSDQPFRTLKKAIDSVPVGGVGIINIVTNVVIDTDINVFNKYINITGKKLSSTKGDYTKLIFKRTYRNAYHDRFYSINCKNSLLHIERTNIDLSDAHKIHGDLDVWGNPFILKNTPLIINGLYYSDDKPIINSKNNSDIYLVGNIYSEGIQIISVNYMTIQHNDTQNFYIKKIEATQTLSFTSWAVDNPANDMTKYIVGIAKDSNGVPRNIVSNLVF